MTLRLPAAILGELAAHARRAAPEECVGLLFGVGATVARAVALRNVAPSPRTRAFADPQGLLRALRGADARGEALLATYHSHPQGGAGPSPTDVAEARGVFLIVAPGGVRAFRVVAGAAQEVGLEVSEPCPLQGRSG